jgi:diguanylate cyclase (GGDEF)-like protein/PAS domain S-box-containing protein
MVDVHNMLHELQVHQIELEMQNEALYEARHAEQLALQRYTEFFDFAPIGYFILDPTSEITQVNLRGANLLELERSKLTGRRFLAYVALEHRVTFSDFLTKAFNTGDKQNCEILVQVGKHDLWLGLEANIGVTATDCLVAIIDFTERKNILSALRESEQKFRLLYEKAPVMMNSVNANGAIETVNEQWLKTMGYQLDEVVGKKRLHFFTDESREYSKNEVLPKFIKDGYANNIEYDLVKKDGSVINVELSAISLLDENGKMKTSLATMIDVTARNIAESRIKKSEKERKLAEEKLKRLAHYDKLTNLPNRVLLADRLSQAMLHCQRRNHSLAVAYLDLDGFKTVNDTFGHDVGDKLLNTVSLRMKEALREGDTLARIGGDEFIAVLIDLDNTEDQKPVLERLLKAAAEPVIVGDAVMKVSVSIGVTLYPQDGADADQLIRHADQAMYIAKQAGKNRYHLFDTAQDNAINILRQNIDDVRSALERREFVLHYQPKVNMHTSEVIGVEALIRWQHPERGLVPPLDFLPAIEGHAISLELGEWVIDTALSQIKQWQSMGVDLPISVNISAYQLQQVDFTNRLSTLLAAHPEVNPHYLELEILESSVLSDIGQVLDTMNACHDLGVRFALDDFGTGYSSLTHLRRLPAHMIKIDQSFVRDMLEDADDLAIVEGVIGLAKAFHRDVIAEGVETIAHGEALLQLGCELAQGYGIARPMPSGDIPEWVSNWKADDSWQAQRLIGANRLGHRA